MMKKIYHLSTCDTCRRILKETGAAKKNIQFQDIKSSPVTPEQLEEMKALAGSYEALFSRKAQKYKSLGLAGKMLSEMDYRDLILSEYSFLKRPVVILGKKLYAGSSAETKEALLNA